MSILNSHNKSLKAEWLKLKHSGIFWLCFGSALFVPLINTIAGFFRSSNGIPSETNVWSSFIESNFIGFTSFFFPIFLVLLVVRLVYLEHRSDTWKLLETQPVTKFSLFFSKWEVAAILSFICLSLLLVFTIIGGYTLQLFKTNAQLSNHSIEWSSTVIVMLRFWISSLAIISIQYFFGLLIKSFAWPMGIGLIGTITGSIFVGFGVLTWWPYATTALTAQTYRGSLTGGFLLQHEVTSILWSLLFICLGYQLYAGKSFKRAFISPFSKLATFVVLLVAFAALTWFISRPKSIEPYGKTILAGTVKSKKSVNNIVLLQAPAMDTILYAPIENGRFHIATNKPIDAGIYYLRAGNYRSQVFFSSGDSLFIDLNLRNQTNEAKITGTRIAENSYLEQGGGSNMSWILTEYAYSFTPKEYATHVMNEWRSAVKDIEKFKTIDNIKPRADFINAQKKLVALRLNGLLENYYPGVFSIYHPNEVLEYPKSIERLKKAADINDNSLATYADYRRYIMETYRGKSGRNDSLYISFIDNGLKDGKAKDFVLFDVVQNDVFRIRDSARRAMVLQHILASISDKKLVNILLAKNANLQNLQRGKKAQNFLAEALNNSTFDLTRLANRYLVIDVWATWCKPCKTEAPFFEDLADRYTNENIAFVSISIDENKNAWMMEAGNKKGKVLQLWAKNAEEDFGKKYALNTIPRFMLIDWKGNIVNAEMPYPSDPEFEAILQKEIPFLRN